MSNFEVFMFLASKQNYSDAFPLKKPNIKFLILSVQKHLILEISFFLKSVVKTFYHDLKGRRQSHESPDQLAVSLKMPVIKNKYCDKC